MDSRHTCVQIYFGLAEVVQTPINSPKARGRHSKEQQIFPFIASRLKSKHNQLISLSHLTGHQATKSKGLFIVPLCPVTDHRDKPAWLQTRRNVSQAKPCYPRSDPCVAAKGCSWVHSCAASKGWTRFLTKNNHGEDKQFCQQIADKSGNLWAWFGIAHTISPAFHKSALAFIIR